jgi:hypothetical protein
VLLIAWSDETVNFALEFDFLVVGVGIIPFGEPSLASGVGVLVRRVECRGRAGETNWRFWMRMKEMTILVVCQGVR